MKNTRTKILVLSLGIVLAIIIVMSSVFFIQTRPASSESKMVFVTFTEDTTLVEALDQLEEEGVLKSAFYTRLLAKFTGEPAVQTGSFVFNPTWSSKHVLERIEEPETMEVEVRFPEGGQAWAKNFAAILEENLEIPAEDFLLLWNDTEYIGDLLTRYDVLPREILANDQAKVRLEGFLYPDTYRFNRGSSIEEVTEIILDNTQAKYETYRDELGKTDLNLYDLMTLSSIVEYEARTEEDMRIVAGVFFNRLADDMRLESSVTVCYALYDFDSWEECEANPNVASPYNTYLEEGLPPGAVLNPTVRSIEAVLNYTKNDYFYFIADVHNDGKIYYQKDYPEHEAMRKKLLGY